MNQDDKKTVTNYQVRGIVNFCNDLLAGRKRVLVFEADENGVITEKATGRLFHKTKEDFELHKEVSVMK